MNIIYNAAISLYATAVRVASVRNRKAKLMVAGQACTFDILGKYIDRNAKYVWIHVSSLGEFEQGRPLIEMLKRRHPEKMILLTFFYSLLLNLSIRLKTCNRTRTVHHYIHSL